MSKAKRIADLKSQMARALAEGKHNEYIDLLMSLSQVTEGK